MSIRKNLRIFVVLLVTFMLSVTSIITVWAEEEGIRMQLPVYDQRKLYPTGCEFAAVAAAAVYCGVELSSDPIGDVWKATLRVTGVGPENTDPSKGFAGNPTNGTGHTMYPNVMIQVAEDFGLTGEEVSSVEQIKQHLEAGHPVVVILGKMNDDTKIRDCNLHTVALSGYDKNFFYFSDSLTGKEEKMGCAEFSERFSNKGCRAAAIWESVPEVELEVEPEPEPEPIPAPEPEPIPAPVLDIKIVVDGEILKYEDGTEVVVTLINGKAYISNLSVVEKCIGKQVTFNQDSTSVCFADGIKIVWEDGVDGKKAIPIFRDGVIYVPVATLAKQVGLTVSWDGEGYTMYIDNPLQ